MWSTVMVYAWQNDSKKWNHSSVSQSQKKVLYLPDGTHAPKCMFRQYPLFYERIDDFRMLDEFIETSLTVWADHNIIQN